MLADTYKRIRGSVVGIAIERETEKGVRFLFIGSGACIDPSGIIVTAKHVVEYYYKNIKQEEFRPGKILSPPDFRVIFSRRGEASYEVFTATPLAIMAEAEADIAILIVPPKNIAWPYISLPTKWNIFEGDRIATAGFPLRSINRAIAFPHLFSGIVSLIDAEYIKDEGWLPRKIHLDISVHPGNSGGPVFDISTGELIGIISSQWLRQFDVQEISQILKNESGSEGISVWTNIAECVPWPIIVNGLEMARQHIKEKEEDD